MYLYSSFTYDPMFRGICLLLILCNSYLAFAEYKEVTFIQATPEEVMNTLNESGQYSLIYFTADWCLPCQILEEGHFRDERIINLINNGLLSVKADYSEKKDIDWYATYEVKMLPTLMVIDKNGNEVDRIQNIRNTRQLYLFLHQYSQFPITSSKPMAFKLEDKKSKRKTIIPSDPKVVTVAYAAESKPKALLVSNATNTKKSIGKNIYAVDVENYQSGLSIQFGAYNRYGDALKYLNTLQKEGMSVSILEEFVKGRKYFKVVQRVSKSDVNTLYSKYQNEGIDCFIRPATLKS